MQSSSETGPYAPDQIVSYERSLLGGILFDNSRLALLPELSPSDFLDGRNAHVFDAMRALSAASMAIDFVTLDAALLRAGKHAEAGGVYIAELTLSFPTENNTLEYARIVRRASLGRKVRATIAEVAEHAARYELDGPEILSDALARLSALDAEQPMGVETVGALVRDRLKQLEVIANERSKGGTALSGFPTGVALLDEKIGGWQPGIVTIVAARPGAGKSSLGLATADACSAANIGVHVFSLEDTRESYADRSIARLSGVSAEKIRNAELQRGDMDEIGRAVTKLHKRTTWTLDQRSGITAEEIVRSVRRCRKANGTKVVIVDYVQLVKPERSGQRHEELTQIVTTLADAAKQDGMAYVVMSQLNRAVESRTDKRPQLSDLRESGSLEERAKCVVALYRGAMYGEPVDGVDWDSKDPDSRKPTRYEHERAVQLLVLKNSNGRTGVIRASWDGQCMRLS